MADPFADLIPQGGSEQVIATPQSTGEINADALPQGLKPYAKDFEEAGNKYGIDPNFLAAIAWNETGGGTSRAFRQGNNAMGISNASGPLYGFASPAESIEKQAATLARPTGPYKGASTIQEVGSIYSPVGAANDPYHLNADWTGSVGNFYNKLTGRGNNAPVLNIAFAPKSETTKNQDPFADLIPQQQSVNAPTQQQSADPFVDLIPAQQQQSQPTSSDASYLTSPVPIEQTPQPSQLTSALSGAFEGTMGLLGGLGAGAITEAIGVPTTGPIGLVAGVPAFFAGMKAGQLGAKAIEKKFGFEPEVQASQQAYPKTAFIGQNVPQLPLAAESALGYGTKYLAEGLGPVLGQAATQAGIGAVAGEPIRYGIDVAAQKLGATEEKPQPITPGSVAETAAYFAGLGGKYEPKAPELAPSANPIVNQREEQILTSANAQATVPEAPKPVETAPVAPAAPAADLTTLLTEQLFHEEGSDKWNEYQAQIDAIRNAPNLPVEETKAKETEPKADIVSVSDYMGNASKWAVVPSDSPSDPDRPVVFVKIGDTTIPFYRSSKGTSGKKEGGWFPFFGAGSTEGADWIIKGTSKDLETGHGVEEIKQAQDHLNGQYKGTAEQVIDQLQGEFGNRSIMGLRMISKQLFGKAKFDDVSPSEGSINHIDSIISKIKKELKPAEAPAPVSDLDQKLQDLTNEQNRLVIEELPKYPEGSIGRRQIQNRINAIRLQQVELNRQRELVISEETKPAEESAQPTQENAVQEQTTGEVGVRNAPAVGEGVGTENKPEVPTKKAKAKKEEVVLTDEQQAEKVLLDKIDAEAGNPKAPKPKAPQVNPYSEVLRRYESGEEDSISTPQELVVEISKVARKQRNQYLKDAVDRFYDAMDVGADVQPEVEKLLDEVKREQNRYKAPAPEKAPKRKSPKDKAQEVFGDAANKLSYVLENKILDPSVYRRMVKKGIIQGGGEYDFFYNSKLPKNVRDLIFKRDGSPIDKVAGAMGKTPHELLSQIQEAYISADKAREEIKAIEKEQRDQEKNARRMEALKKRDPQAYERIAEEEARKLLNSKLRREGGFVEFPDFVKEAAIKVGDAVRKGATSFRDWSRKMVSRLGEGVRDFLKDIWAGVRDNWNKDIGGGSDTGGRSREQAQREAEAKYGPKAPTDKESFAKKAADALLKGRGTPITEDEMQNILSRKFPGITSREASDLYASATGTPKPPTPYAGVADEPSGESISIRSEDQSDQVRRGILTSVVPAGKGTSRAEILQQGNANLQNGVNPFDALEKAKQGDFNALTTAKAYSQALAKKVSDALKKFGPNSKEYKDLAKQYQDYYQGIREAGTVASDILRTFQGETDLSDAADIARQYTQDTGQEPTLSQHEQIRKVADDVNKSIEESEKAIDDHRATLDEGLSDVDVNTPQSVDEGRQQVADLSDASGKKSKAEIDRLNKELEETKKTLEEVKQAKETGQDAASLREYYEAKIADLNKKLEGTPKHGKEVLEQAQKIVDKWKADRLEAEKLLTKQLSQLGAFPDPTIIGTLARIMRGHIGELGLDFARSSKMLIEKFGNKIEPYLKEAWAKAQELIKGETGGEKAVKTIRSKSSPEDRRIKSLEKQVYDNEEKIASLKEGKLPESKTSQKATNDRIKALENQTKQQRKQISELKKKLTQKPLTPAEKEADNLRKRIAQYEKKIKDIEEGRVTTPKDVEKATNEEIRGLESDLAKKKQELSDARLKAKQADLFEKGKLGEKLNPEQVKTLWESAKRFYLDKGEADYDKMINDLANDFGITPEQVREAFSSPKGAKKTSDQLYLKQRNRQLALNRAKRWLENQKASWIGKIFGAAAERTFKLAIFGHGTAFIGTHAPTTIYTHPKAAFRAWLKGLSYSFRGKNGRVQNVVDNKDLIFRPNWVTARKAGLENDPFKNEHEGPSKATSDSLLGRSLDALTGGRGFDALYHLRQDMFDQAWEKLSITQRTPEMANIIADSVNNATGFTKGGKNTAGILQSPITKVLFFAPKLIASRFNWLIGDPARMIGTFVKMANPLAKVTPEERMSAFSEAKNKLAFLGTLAGTLLANQALLSVTGSNQNVNFFDPKKNDWLAYKGFGYQLATVGALTRIARLLAQEYNAVFGDLTRIQKARGGREAAMKDALYTYFRSGFSPIIRDIVVVATGKDYVGNTVPWSSEQPDRGRRKLTWNEIVQEQLAPIPISEAATQKEIVPAVAKAGTAALLGARLETPADIEEYQKSLQAKPRRKSAGFGAGLGKGL